MNSNSGGEIGFPMRNDSHDEDDEDEVYLEEKTSNVVKLSGGPSKREGHNPIVSGSEISEGMNKMEENRPDEQTETDL